MGRASQRLRLPGTTYLMNLTRSDTLRVRDAPGKFQEGRAGGRGRSQSLGASRELSGPPGPPPPCTVRGPSLRGHGPYPGCPKKPEGMVYPQTWLPGPRGQDGVSAGRVGLEPSEPSRTFFRLFPWPSIPLCVCVRTYTQIHTQNSTPITHT